jgi:hypothetical protein
MFQPDHRHTDSMRHAFRRHGRVQMLVGRPCRHEAAAAFRERCEASAPMLSRTSSGVEHERPIDA